MQRGRRKTAVNIDHVSKDNRNYDFTLHPDDGRQEYSVIASMVPLGSRVIDLGCGNGTLLQQLRQDRKAIVAGIELSISGVQVCQAKGLNVRQGRIDEHLPYENNSFDYAICNVTIQMVMYPEVLLSEMKRIAKFQIISFPNFGFYRNRIQFLLRGAMPTHMLFGYQWYNTGHLHQLSIIDFRYLVHDVGGLVERKLSMPSLQKVIKRIFMNVFPNLLMPLPIILLEKTEHEQ